MKRLKAILALLLPLAWVTFISCYSMDVHTVRSDDLALYKEDKILVFVDSADLKLQEDLSRRISGEFSKWGANAVCFQDIFSPLKTYSPEDISELLSINRIDALLTVTVAQGSDYAGSVLLYGTALPVYNNQLFMQVELNDRKTGQAILKATITGESEDLSIESLLKKTPERIVHTVFPEIKDEVKAEKARKAAEREEQERNAQSW